MSAKGRGSAVVEHEFYGTPAWCTRRILDALSPELPINRSWLEPCAGDGAISDVVNRMRDEVCIHGGDIRDLPRAKGVHGSWLPGKGFDVWSDWHPQVITNPPFSLAPELTDHFLPRCDWLILLLRSAFKLARWRDNMPDEYKLPQRPEFVASERCKGRTGDAYVELSDGSQLKVGEGCGWALKLAIEAAPTAKCPECGGRVQRSTSDASEYSWFVWTPERGRKFGRTCVLPDTPLAERRQRMFAQRMKELDAQQSGAQGEAGTKVEP